MSLVEILDTATEDGLKELESKIYNEMVWEVSGHSRSGKALSAIHIVRESRHQSFVGGTDGTGTGKTGTDHLAMLNDGNGFKMIVPKRAKALRYTDGTFHAWSKPYYGIHFIEEIANRHR